MGGSLASSGGEQKRERGRVLAVLFYQALLILGLQVDAKRKPEDEKGREDGCLRFLLKFLLNALQEILQQVRKTLEHRLRHSLERKERGERKGERKKERELIH